MELFTYPMLSRYRGSRYRCKTCGKILTARQLGLNQRALGTNPRSLGTNPKAKRKARKAG